MNDSERSSCAAATAVAVRRRGGGVPRSGLLAAGAVGLMLLGGVLLMVQRPQPGAGQPPGRAASTPDLSNVPVLAGTPGGLAQGAGFFMQFADRNDASRIAGEVTAQASQPLPERRYELSKPRAWFFADDARSLYIEADEGVMKVARGEGTGGGGGNGLESGSLVGNVVVRVFAASATRPDPATMPALATLRTSRLSVDWLLGQLDMPEDFVAEWQATSYSGRGGMVQFDPQTRVVDSIAITQTREVILREGAEQVGGAGPSSGKSAGALAQQPVQAVGEAEETAEEDSASGASSLPTHYTLTSPGTVRVVREGAVLEAGSLRGAARVVQGRFEPAVPSQRVRGERSGEAPGARGETGTSEQSQAAQTMGGTAPLPGSDARAEPAASDVLTRLTLAGPVEVRRVIDAPSQVQRDGWWAELVGTDEQPVTARDETRGLRMRAAQATIAGTRSLLTLTSPTEGGVVVQADANGQLAARTVEVDELASVARVLGAGRLVGTVASVSHARATADDSRTPPDVTWTDKAEFVFASADGATNRGQLERAHFVGQVRSRSGGSLVEGNEVSLDFATLAGRSGGSSPLLATQAQVVGGARVTDSQGAILSADVLKLELAPDPPSDGATTPSSSSPRRFVASGSALARVPAGTTPSTRADGTRLWDSLKAARLEGTFAPRDAGEAATSDNRDSVQRNDRIELATLEAFSEGGVPVTFEGHGGIVALGQTLRAMPSDERVELRGAAGQPALVTQGSTRAQGPIIELSGKQRMAQLPSGGMLQMEQRKAGPGTVVVQTLVAQADGLIRYQEATSNSPGEAVLEDNVRVTLDDAATSARVEARRVAVEFLSPSEEGVEAAQAGGARSGSSMVRGAPRASGEADVDADSAERGPVAIAAGNMRVQRVTASGLETQAQRVLATATIVTKDPQRPATYFIQAPTLVAFPEQREFEALGVGQLLATTTPGSGADAGMFASARSAGDTLLSWRERLVYRESAGSAVATGRVRLAHRDAPAVDARGVDGQATASGDPALLECETLTMRLMDQATRDAERQKEAQAAQATLREATAEGGVWGNLQGQEFTAARAVYDAVAGLIDATGDGQTLVNIASKDGTAPLSAARVRMQTRTGRVEILDPGTIQTGPK